MSDLEVESVVYWFHTSLNWRGKLEAIRDFRDMCPFINRINIRDVSAWMVSNGLVEYYKGFGK